MSAEGSARPGGERTSESVSWGVCNLCEAICGLEFRIADGRITSIRGDERDEFSHGHICPKAVALKHIHEDPDRIKRPQHAQHDVAAQQFVNVLRSRPRFH